MIGDYETDNFAHIIGVRRDHDEQLQRLYESQRAFDEAQERDRPWCWAIGITMAVILALFFYFTRGGAE